MQAEKQSLLVIGHALTVDVIGLVRILVGGRNAKTPERRSQSRSCNHFTFYGKQHSDSAYDSDVCDHVKPGSSESQAEAEQLNQSQSVGTCLEIGLSFRLCFRLRQSGFH